MPQLGLLGTRGRGGWHRGPQGAEGADCSAPGWEQGLGAERHASHFASQTWGVWRQESEILAWEAARPPTKAR